MLSSVPLIGVCRAGFLQRSPWKYRTQASSNKINLINQNTAASVLMGKLGNPAQVLPQGKKNTPHSQKSLFPYRQETRKHNLCYKAQPLKTTSKTLMLFKLKKSQLQSHPSCVHFKPSLQKTSSAQHYNTASKRTYWCTRSHKASVF